MSQTQPDAPLFYLGQDNITIDELLILGAGLGVAMETWIDIDKNTCETDDENQIKTQFMSSQAFHRIPCGRVRETTV
jgi:plasmid maintenance system antidote protein VapI